jgi:hypothetical protein
MVGKGSGNKPFKASSVDTKGRKCFKYSFAMGESTSRAVVCRYGLGSINIKTVS